MLSSMNRHAAAGAVMLGSMLCVATADAGVRVRCGSRADVDIESLKAETRRGGHDRRGRRSADELIVRYEIEIEDARRGERFDLVLTLTDGKRAIRDRRGRPMQLVIPLRCPTDRDRDELEFERTIRSAIPSDLARRGCRLAVQAEVIRVADGRVMDRKCASIRR